MNGKIFMDNVHKQKKDKIVVIINRGKLYFSSLPSPSEGPPGSHVHSNMDPWVKAKLMLMRYCKCSKLRKREVRCIFVTENGKKWKRN